MGEWENGSGGESPISECGLRNSRGANIELRTSNIERRTREGDRVMEEKASAERRRRSDRLLPEDQYARYRLLRAWVIVGSRLIKELEEEEEQTTG